MRYFIYTNKLHNKFNNFSSRLVYKIGLKNKIEEMVT